MTIIDRLARNAQKQKVYRHIVRGRATCVSYATAKKHADMYFLYTYTNITHVRLGKLFGVSTSRSIQIVDKVRGYKGGNLAFTICHPRKSCM